MCPPILTGMKHEQMCPILTQGWSLHADAHAAMQTPMQTPMQTLMHTPMQTPSLCENRTHFFIPVRIGHICSFLCENGIYTFMIY